VVKLSTTYNFHVERAGESIQGNLESLWHLQLSPNQLETHPKELANCTSNHLDLRGTPLESIPKGLKKVDKKTKEEIRSQEEAFADFLIDMALNVRELSLPVGRGLPADKVKIAFHAVNY
jgi:hypothetical protein